MPVTKRLPIRFGLLTALVWLAVAAGSIFLLWYAITRISAGAMPISTVTPNETQVIQTIAALVNSQATSTAADATQTVTPTPPQNTPTGSFPSPKATITPAGVTHTATPTTRCDLAGAGNPLDVTIPDDTVIPAGGSFVKTWKLVNTGSCTWTSSYSASFFYGDRMGAPQAVPLAGNILPDQSVEISVDMVAPSTPGAYQGNWKLMNPAGELFGIGPSGDLPFWVRISVPENTASTATLTPVPTGTQGATPTGNPSPTPTSTATPPIQASGELSPTPGDGIDLDDLTLNGSGDDLLYQEDANNFHWLTPVDQAMIGVFGSRQPGLADCQTASMSQAPIAVESLTAGTYLCYKSNEERLGRVLLVAVDPSDFTLTLDLLTWALP